MKKLMSFLLCMIMAFTFVGGFVGDGYVLEADAAAYTLPYYYYQLSEKEQGYYKQMKDAALKHKSSVKIKAKLDEDTLQKLVNLLYYYDVQTFNFENFSAEIYASYTILYFEYRYNQESYEKMMEVLNQKADAVIAKFTDETKTYTKIKTIHDYVVNHTEYDLNAQTADLAYGSIIKGIAKCDGYSKAFAYICSRAGIRTVNVIGTAKEDHMWNMVYYNKQWYNIDVTWDDPVGNAKTNLSYDYFMVEDKLFNKDHTVASCEFDVPKATSSDKSYYDIYKLTAEDTASAKALLISQIAKAADKKKTSVTIQFETKAALDNAMSKFNADNGDMMFDILESAQKKTKTKIITNGYQSGTSDTMYTFTMYIYYPKTSLSYYYADPSQVDSGTKDFLKQLGVSA